MQAAVRVRPNSCSRTGRQPAREHSVRQRRPAARHVSMASAANGNPAPSIAAAAAAAAAAASDALSEPILTPPASVGATTAAAILEAIPGGDSSSSSGAPSSASTTAVFPSSVAAALELEEMQHMSSSDGKVEQLRVELSDLRSLLIAQARLVQTQQRHIQQLETAVNRAVEQSTHSAAAAAVAAVEAAAAEASGAAALASADAAAAAGGSMDGATGTAAGRGGSGTARRSSMLEGIIAEEERSKRMLQSAELQDRRGTGLFDARYHSTSWGATPRDMRVLPKRIFLVRHAESEGNVDNTAYSYLPDPRVPLTARGWQQAMQAGDRLRAELDTVNCGKPYNLFFYTSPYLRSRQTYEGLAQAFQPEQVKGVQEEVQLREQDFGNFQDTEGKKREKAERLRFGRFFYRFPNGESGADVYDRMTIFEDHLVRDINAGRFADNSSLVLVTHGLALRVFLMRWFHWTVDQFMSVFNPPNAEPLVLERVPSDVEARQGGPVAWIHTKALYRLSDGSREIIKGCTEDMCQTSWAPRQINPLDPADSLLLP